MNHATVNWARVLGEIAWHLGTEIEGMPGVRNAVGTRELSKRIGLLMRGMAGARAELSLAVLAYNLKRVLNMKGSSWMRSATAA